MKLFREKLYCVDGIGVVKVVNKCGKVVFFCQIVFFGNEVMIILIDVFDIMIFFVLDVLYWV